jgi:Putative phage metallopeptidase
MPDLMDQLTAGNGHGQIEPAEKEAPRILRCHEAESIARDLIQRFHGHLTNATILCLTTSQTRKKKGKQVDATTKKVDPMLRYFSEADFIILIDETHWMYLEEDRKRALIDRQLCYCGVDDRGKWVIWPTDVECFIAEVTRNGLWQEDVRVFVEAARAIPDAA